MRHANIDELLSVRDRAPVDVDAVRHLDECETCQRELEALEERRAALRALPGLRPERELWQDIVARAGDGGEATLPGTSGRYIGAVGLAATVVMAVAIGLLRPPMDADPATEVGPPVTAETGSASDGQTLDQLIAESRRLERSLRAVTLDGQVVNTRSAATMSALEQRIALIDYQLARGADGGLSPRQQRMLWQQRVELMNSLVRLRHAEARRTDF